MAIENGGAAQNYQTLQAAGSHPQGFGHADAGWTLNGTAGRFDARGLEDDYTQAGDLFRLMEADEQEKLISNIAGAMADIPMDIKLLQIEHFTKADPKYGADVKRKLGL